MFLNIKIPNSPFEACSHGLQIRASILLSPFEGGQGDVTPPLKGARGMFHDNLKKTSNIKKNGKK